MLRSMENPVQTVLPRVRRRLIRRRLLEGALLGLTCGLVLAVPALGTGRWLGLSTGPCALLVLVPGGLGLLIGTTVAVSRRGLRRTELAQLLDRRLDTDEAWVTAEWLDRTPEAPRREERLQALTPLLQAPPPHTLLPLRFPRTTRFIPVLLLLLGATLLIPARPATGSGPQAQEAERLAERLAELEQRTPEAPLPEDLGEALDTLQEDLSGETMSPEEAVERIADLQELLDAHADSLRSSPDLLDELERAAEQLASQPELAEALEQLDPDAGGPTGEQLAQAGEQLAQSGDPEVKALGEQLAATGEQLASPEPAEQAQGQQALQEAIERSRELGQRLEQDQRALERAERTRGALEAARQRLDRPAGAEGEPGGDADETGEQGPSGEGSSQGTPGQGGPGQSDERTAEAGLEHTWEDQGQRPAQPSPAEDRNSERTAGADQSIDDFERLYAARRLDDVDGLLTSVPGQLDERGRIELVPQRRTGSDETAERPLLDVPDGYTRSARQAIADETVPPGYRDAVRHYFDQME